MLTTEQLRKIFSKSERKDAAPTVDEISSIMSHVEVESGVCKNGVDYYFRIKLIDLSKSGISDDTIFSMAMNGWVLSKDIRNIEFFY